MRWVLVGLLVAAAPAHAGDGDPAAVTARLDGITARLTARFELAVSAGTNLGLSSIQLPPRGIVTGATARVGAAKRRLRLEGAEHVATTIDKLTYKPGHGSERTWAIAIAGAAENIQVDMMSPIETRIVVELEVDAPTCFFRDARYVLVPAGWAARAPGHVRVRADEDRLADACVFAPDEMQWLVFPSKHLGAAQRTGTLGARLALDGGHVARVELDLARELGEVPRDLHTVIVVDHSRSLLRQELEAQRRTVAAYLRAAPTSQVQVIGYSRDARALLPAWMTAAQALGRVDREIRALAPRNGSNVDVALREAATWLGRASGTKRVLLFSDERLAKRIAVGGLDDLLPAGTLVHVVVPSEGGGRPVRFDDGQLAELAKTTAGIEVTSEVDENGAVDATTLLRPNSLDHVAITAPGWEGFEVDQDPRCELDAVDEGRSCVWWLHGGAAAGPVTIEGLIWNRPFRRVVRPDPAQGRTIARIMSAAIAFDGELQAQIDRAARAVNSAWSLLGTWGKSGGYEDLGGFGTISTGRFVSRHGTHDRGIGSGTSTRRVLDVRAQIVPAVTGCHPGQARMSIVIETTREEIVDVIVDVEPRDPVLRDCITEAVWNTTLLIANPPNHTTTRLRF